MSTTNIYATNQYSPGNAPKGDVSTGGSNTKLKGFKGIRGALPGDRPSDLPTEGILDEELRNEFIRLRQELSMGARNPREFSWTQAPLPQENIGLQVGDSKYDTGITSRSQLEDINNTRGELQPWWDLIGAGIAKMGVLAGTTFVNSTVGLLAGGMTAIAEGRWSGIWDNGVNRLMNNINEASEEYFKNYYTNQEMAAPWYANLGTANFIGDKMLKNMGFTIGAIGAGALTGGISSNLLAGVKGGQLITRGLSSVISAAGEASIEALHASNDYIKANQNFIQQNYEKGLTDLNTKYAAILNDLDNKYNATGDQLITIKGDDGLLKTVSKKSMEFDALHAEYLNEKGIIDAEKEKLEHKVKEDALKVGNTTFGLNQLLLAATNNIQFGRILSGGYANAAKAASLTMKSKATGETIKDVSKAAQSLVKGDLEFAAKEGFGKAVAGKALRNAASEGFEEGAQNFVANTAQIQYSGALNTFAGAKINPYVQDEVNSFLSAGNQTLQEQFGTIDSPGWEEVTLGFLTGAIGVPFFKKGGRFGVQASWAGGVKEAYEEVKHDFKANDVVSRINEQIQKPEFLTRYQGLIRHNNFQKLMDESLANKNEFEYSNSEASQLVSDILMFRDAGQIDTLKSFFNTYTELSDEDIEEIKKGTTVQGTNTSIKGDDLVEKTKKDITERAKKLSKTIDDISNIHDYHLVKYGNDFEKDGLEELTWMRASIDNHQERFQEKVLKFKDTILPILQTVDPEKLKDKDGNPITNLLEMDPKVLFTSLLNKDNDMYATIVDALGKQKGRYDKLVSEATALQKNKDYLEKKGKGKKATKLQKQLNDVLELTKGIEESGTLINQEDLSELFMDALASAASVMTLSHKYEKAIKDPSSLNKSIEADKDAASQTSSNIQNAKVEQDASTSKDIKELKKHIAPLNKVDRYNLLDKLSKQEGTLGQLAKDLKSLDTMHGAFGSMLEQEEFSHLSENDKTALRNAIDKSYNISSSPKSFISNLQANAHESLFQTTEDMVKFYNEGNENARGFEDESPAAQNPPKPGPVENPEAPQSNPEDVPAPALNVPNPLVVPTEDNTKPQPSLDVSMFTYEDLYRASNLYSDEDLATMANDPNKFNALAQERALKFLTLSEEEIFNQYKKDLEDPNVKVELTDEEILKEVRQNIKYFKDKYKASQEDDSVTDTPTSPKQAADSIEETSTALDNVNDLPNSQIAIRSDAITEADIERLFPLGQGMNKRGDRTFVPLANLKKYEHFINYLIQAGAFDFVNKGKLADILKNAPDTKIHFIVDKSLNNYEREGRFPLQDTVLLAVESNETTAKEINGKKYLIVGAIKNSNTMAGNIVNRVIAEAKSSKDPIVLSELSSEVDFIYPGRIATSKGEIKNTERPLSFGDLATSADNKFHIAVMGKNNTLHCPTLDELDVVVPVNTSENRGRIYLMIKAADGKYYPTPLGEKLFNKTDFPAENFGSTPLFMKIKEAMKIFMDPTLSKKERLDARDEFEKFVYIGKRIGDTTSGNEVFRLGFASDPITQKHFIQVFRTVGTDEGGNVKYEVVEKPEGGHWTINLNGNFEQEFEQFLDLMDYINPRFQVNKKLIADEDMVELLVTSGILTTNLAALQTFNANFTIKGLDVDGKIMETPSTDSEVHSTGTAKKSNINGNPEHTIVYYNKTKYKVTADNKILDENNKPITDKTIQATVTAAYKISKGEGILNKREGTTATLYSLGLNGEEFGALVDKKTNAIKTFFGMEYIELVNKFDTAKNGNHSKIKSTLDLTGVNAHAKSIIENGYDPSLYVTEVYGKDAPYLRVRLKSNNEVVAEIPFTLTRQKEVGNILSGKNNLTAEDENSLIGTVIQAALKDNIDNLKNVKTTPVEKPVVNTPTIITKAYDKPWKDEPTNSNKARLFSLSTKPEEYFELVEDIDKNTLMPNGEYSVHFKTSDKNALTEDEKVQLFKALADAVPEGAKLSTWGNVTKGGIAGLNRFTSLGFIKTKETRNGKDSDGNDIKIPVYIKQQGKSKPESTQLTKTPVDVPTISNVPKGKTTVNKLLDINDSKTNENNLVIPEKVSTFAKMGREELKSIANALKDKNIAARTKDKIEAAVKELLKVDDAILSSMSVEAIISEINCK